MDGFFKIPSALKIFMLELIAIFFFPVTVAGIITEISPGIFPPYNDLNGFGEWLMAFVGPLFLTWVLYDNFRPRVKDQVWGTFGKVRFKFCSTHPSYVLIDMLTIGFAAFSLWIGITGEFAMGVFWLVLATAILFPIARLSAWYLIGLKINDPEIYGAYKPALWSFCIFTAIFGGAALAVALT